MQLNLCDYLNEDDGVTTLCDTCACHEGLEAFCVGIAPDAEQCDVCGCKAVAIERSENGF